MSEFNWQEAKSNCTPQFVRDVAHLRGVAELTVEGLVQRNWIGSVYVPDWKEKAIAFPICDENGVIYRAHCRGLKTKKWIHVPKEDSQKRRVPALVYGSFAASHAIYIFESQGDAVNLIDLLKLFPELDEEQVCLISTRGAQSYGRLTHFKWPAAGGPKVLIYAFPHNDKDGRNWLDHVLKITGGAYVIEAPAPYSDLGEWAKDGGATAYDIEAAIDHAELRKPAATESEKNGEEQPKWAGALLMGGVSSLELSTLTIAARVVVIDDWCRVGDLGFIFAARGLGKTWLAMHLSKGLATKQNVGPWIIHVQCNVLYLDGEMAPDDIKFRDYALGTPVENLVYINHDILFSRTGKIMNLADPEFQDATLAHCQQAKFNVLCLDNLSTLASGIDENKTIDWEIIQPWLLKLRRIGVTVIFIHHAGRNNQMRGGSKREDPASWVLRLDHPYNGDESVGAHFISRFTKWRGAKKQPKTYEWVYRPEIGGEILVEVKEASSIILFRQMIEDGLETCSAIAEEMGVSMGLISRFATQAEKQGWLVKKGRKYVLVESCK